MIFGGFCSGNRINACYIAYKSASGLEWLEVGKNSPDKPCVRASHSAVVNGTKCYIFGGQDDENNKLNDLWEYDMETEIFSKIELGPNSYQPMARSGHSANMYNKKMYIFGGIFEITKELSELLCYDFDTQCFECIAGESGDNGVASAIQREAGNDSPGVKKANTMKATKSSNQAGSPSKLGGTFGSPSKTGKGLSLTAKARRAGKSPKKGGEVVEGSKEKKKESGLASPTSISMQNTFIIMNADESFDQYYAHMRKRKAGMTGMDNSMGHNGGSPGAHRESIFGVVSGVSPAARDGHTCEISPEGYMFVFGGDRHHMAFNDLYLLNLNE